MTIGEYDRLYNRACKCRVVQLYGRVGRPFINKVDMQYFAKGQLEDICAILGIDVSVTTNKITLTLTICL